MGAGYYWLVTDACRGAVYRVYAVTRAQAVAEVEANGGEWVRNIPPSRALTAVPEDEHEDQP